ncbi:MAG: hypothetical protein PHU63_01495 [Candidatus ainarchaeum sp.]|nr:hypothetical protein [Candidatus ainarchaeum sp.]
MVGIPCVDLSSNIDVLDLEVANHMCSNAAFEWQSLIAAALFASVMVLVFFYLFAILFRNDKVIAWVKMEIYELISTALIVLALVIIIQGLCSFNVGWILSNFQAEQISSQFSSSTNIYTVSSTYFHSVGDRLEKWMCLGMIGGVVADLGSANFNVHPMGQGFATSPMSGFFAPLKLLVNNAMIAMTITFVINEAMLAIMKYSLIAFPKYFLPLGIFFRAFEPTRRFGGTIIALSISMLVIYPIIITLSFYVSEVGVGGWFSFSQLFLLNMSGVITSASDIFSAIGKFFISLVTLGVSGVLGSPIDLIVALAKTVLTVFGEFFGFIFFGIGGIVMWWAALVGFILPAFNTIILVYSMRSLGKTLGEPIDITSLTRVI